VELEAGFKKQPVEHSFASSANSPEVEDLTQLSEFKRWLGPHRLKLESLDIEVSK